MKKTLKIFLVSILVFIPALAKAECSLSLNNLTIDNQTNNNTADIVRLQSIMLVNNLYSGPITGYYGKLTEKAVNKFKINNDLEADGVVDDDTVSLLCNYSCPFKSLLAKNDEYPQQEIKFLQYFLRLIPNIYPEKLVTGFYGSKTELAVKRLQVKLGIDESGKIDVKTQTKFCSFFNELDSETVNTKSETTSSIFQSLCLAFPANTTTGKSVTFISQILGGTSPYKYIWNNKTTNNEKTVKYAFNKAGVYTMNLKVIDAKGNISTSNCNIKVTGDTVSENDLNLNELTFNDEPDLNVSFNDSTTTTKNTPGKVASFDVKAFYQPIEKYINNPVKVDAEVLPVEIVKGDPIKINIINLPVDMNKIMMSQWVAKTNKRLKAYWTGDDLINQSLDRIVLNSDWYSNMNNGAVPVVYKSHSVFANRVTPYGPKTRGWFELPSEKMFLGGNSTAGSYTLKGYNPKDDWLIYQKGLYVDYADMYYMNSVAVKKEIANYFVFDRSGNYSIRFNIYFTNPNDNKEYLVAYTDINLKVLEKPTEGMYAKAYITPGASKGASTCTESFTNSIPNRTMYPYRDLDGKLVGFDWQHLFVDSEYNGGGIWNYLNLTNVFAPVGDKTNLVFGQEGLFKDWERLFKIGTLGSTLYRAFQSDPEDLFYINGRDPVVQDKNMCAIWYNWQSNIPIGSGFGVSGSGFTKNNIYLSNPAKIEGALTCRGVCFQTVDLPDTRKTVTNDKNISLYPDLIIKDYKMENIDKTNGVFDMKYLVRNIGGSDFKVDDNPRVIVTCKNGTEAGTDLKVIHSVSKKTYDIDYGTTITQDIKAGSEMWFKTSSKQYCTVGTVMAGCIIDPSDVIDEQNENNNYIRNVRVDCDIPTTTTTLPNTTVTSKQTSTGIMYNLLTYSGQISACNSDNECTIKNGTVYCTNKWDGAPLTPNTLGKSGVYFDKDCKCVGKRCQAVAK